MVSGIEREITKGHWETFGGDGYIHYFYCGDGFNEYKHVKHSTAHFKYV